MRKIDYWMGLRENSEDAAARHVEFWIKYTAPDSAERIEKLAIEERDLPGSIQQAVLSHGCGFSQDRSWVIGVYFVQLKKWNE